MSGRVQHRVPGGMVEATFHSGPGETMIDFSYERESAFRQAAEAIAALDDVMMYGCDDSTFTISVEDMDDFRKLDAINARNGLAPIGKEVMAEIEARYDYLANALFAHHIDAPGFERDPPYKGTVIFCDMPDHDTFRAALDHMSQLHPSVGESSLAGWNIHDDALVLESIEQLRELNAYLSQQGCDFAEERIAAVEAEFGQLCFERDCMDELDALEEAICMEPCSRTTVPAEAMPEGWEWVMYADGSGSLRGPGNEHLYSYDEQTGELTNLAGEWDELGGGIGDPGYRAVLERAAFRKLQAGEGAQDAPARAARIARPAETKSPSPADSLAQARASAAARNAHAPGAGQPRRGR